MKIQQKRAESNQRVKIGRNTGWGISIEPAREQIKTKVQNFRQKNEKMTKMMLICNNSMFLMILRNFVFSQLFGFRTYSAPLAGSILIPGPVYISTGISIDTARGGE